MMFAIRLKECMHDAHMNGTELSKKACVHYTTISRFLHGKSIPSRPTVEKLADALGCNVDYLMGNSDTKLQVFAEEKITPKNAEGYYDPTAYKALKSIEREEKMAFKRGEIYEYELTNGHGAKYALVVSSDERSTDRVVSVVILNEKAYGNNAASVVAHSLMYADCNRVTFAVADRIGSYVRTATVEEMKEIDQALLNALGIEQIEASGEAELDKALKELEEANAIIEEQRKYLSAASFNCDAQEMRANKLSRENEKMKAELEEKKKNPDGMTVDGMIMQIERDFYKAQYESLLAKILESAV